MSSAAPNRRRRPGRGVLSLTFLTVLGALGLMLFGFALPAAADDYSQISQGLRSSRLHVTSEAQSALPAASRPGVLSALGSAKEADIYAVVTKAGVPQGDLGRMLKGVRDRVGKGDTYVAITADGKMTGISKDLSGKEINQVISKTDGDVQGKLTGFAGLAEDQAAANARTGTIGGFVLLGVLVFVAAGVVGLTFVARGRRRTREAEQLADLKKGVEEDVIRLGEDIAALDLDVMDHQLAPETRDEYTKALDSYDGVKAAVERAAKPDDMRQVTEALEEGRYHMTAVRARLAGEPVPERRAPCFFNPQHGPSVKDVIWAPPGGQPRSVPACAADAKAVLGGLDPDSRLVPVGGERRPYWEAGPAYAPYAGGYYSGFGGFDLLSGMLIGTMLGSMLSGGFGGAGIGGDFGGDTADIGGGWDFGSGDFGGGGDFGGF